jgi:DNA-binding cell septation regulator SpoVG
MKITEIQITPIKPMNGLVAFASCLLDDGLYLGSIGIVTKLEGGYRLVFPTKKVGGKNINIFHPINKKAGEQLAQEIINKFKDVMNQSNDRYYSNYSRSI